MKPIELERWMPSASDPCALEYAGQRTAREVFEELKHRLEDLGYLPDEYFLLDSRWKDGQEIPKGADIFCATDYGASEGIYVDVYLNWREDGRPITEDFITGKTLGENGKDLDRMFLIASAITKAFHGDRTTYERYTPLGKQSQLEGGIYYMSGEERRAVIDALAMRREQLIGDTVQTEQLLRRMTGGGILEYMSEMGCRPLRLSAYDKTVLAVHDGDLEAFQENYLSAIDQAGTLLSETAGRAGAVGQKMLLYLLKEAEDFSAQDFLGACKKAVDTGEMERVQFLLEQAPAHVKELDTDFYGQVVEYAYQNNKHIAHELIRQAGAEQIHSAPPVLFYYAASEQSLSTMEMLVEKGIDTGPYMSRVFQYLTASNQGWMLSFLLDQGMEVRPDNYLPLRICIENDCLEVAENLLNCGIDFDGYLAWVETQPVSGHEDATRQLADYWNEMKQQIQEAVPQMGEIGLA